MQGKGHVVRRMFADVEADVYVMADGDATYDADAAPELVKRLVDEQLDMVVGARKSEVENAYRRGHRVGNRLFTGLMIVAFMSFMCGLILDTVVRGRREVRRLHYLSLPAVGEG